MSIQKIQGIESQSVFDSASFLWWEWFLMDAVKTLVCQHPSDVLWYALSLARSRARSVSLPLSRGLLHLNRILAPLRFKFDKTPLTGICLLVCLLVDEWSLHYNNALICVKTSAGHSWHLLMLLNTSLYFLGSLDLQMFATQTHH